LRCNFLTAPHVRVDFDFDGIGIVFEEIFFGVDGTCRAGDVTLQDDMRIIAKFGFGFVYCVDLLARWRRVAFRYKLGMSGKGKRR
jgi:hypothetical protein